VRRVELLIDVSAATGLAGDNQTAALVCLPDPALIADPPVVAFCWPGGGYSRHYFDIQGPGLEDYSQAEHHANRGVITVACDQLGVGGSSEPDRSQLTHANVAAADRATVDEVLRRLAGGTVSDSFPPITDPVLIGIGQSYGGMLLIVQQGRMRTCDGVAILGYSAIGISPPRPPADGTSSTGGRVPPPSQMSDRELMTFFFHWEDVPDEIVKSDMKGEHPTRSSPLPMWASDRRPGGRHWSPSPPGVVASWADVIECPVFIGVGERDVVPDPHAEPGAYRHSSDVTLFITPTMGHMHNFASSRRLLWDRIGSWMATVADRRA
jgi:pimeloyl-ACP methyl ester carboxylesterase